MTGKESFHFQRPSILGCKVFLLLVGLVSVNHRGHWAPRMTGQHSRASSPQALHWCTPRQAEWSILCNGDKRKKKRPFQKQNKRRQVLPAPRDPIRARGTPRGSPSVVIVVVAAVPGKGRGGEHWGCILSGVYPSPGGCDFHEGRRPLGHCLWPLPSASCHLP